MAPMAICEPYPRKRTASATEFDSPAPKKIQRGQVRHHNATWDLQRDHRRDGVLQNEETADTLLTRSISLALGAVGFEAVGVGALESFRLIVEECMP